MKSTKSVKTNIIWHRRLGLSVFLVLIFLAISGFALNHSPALKLNKISLSNSWLLSWYGFEKPAINGFKLQGQWLYHDGNSQLFLDQKAVAPCSAPLLSSARHSDSIYALCADALLILTENGQLVEIFSQLDGLPIDAQGITVVEGILYLSTDSAVLEFNPDSLALTPEAETAALTPQFTLAPIPVLLEQQLLLCIYAYLVPGNYPVDLRLHR